MSFFTRQKALLALNALALLGGVGWAAWQFPRTVVEPVRTSAAPSAALQLPAVKPYSVQSLEARPLFNRTRAPAIASPVQPVKEPVPTPSAPILLGLAGDEGFMGALLQDPAGRRSHLLLPGQIFAGWTLVFVRSRTVRVKNGQTVVDLPLVPPAAVAKQDTRTPQTAPAGR